MSVRTVLASRPSELLGHLAALWSRRSGSVPPAALKEWIRRDGDAITSELRTAEATAQRRVDMLERQIVDARATVEEAAARVAAYVDAEACILRDLDLNGSTGEPRCHERK
jgi:hypothetical protein